MQPNMPLTPEAVQAVTFDKAPFGRRGYHEDQVDSFLDRVENALSGGEPMTAADVLEAEFDAAPLVRRGYHEGQVDEFLDQVAEHFERAERGEFANDELDRADYGDLGDLGDLGDEDLDDAAPRQVGQASSPRVSLPPTQPGRTPLELPPGMDADPTPPPRRRVIPKGEQRSETRAEPRPEARPAARAEPRPAPQISGPAVTGTSAPAAAAASVPADFEPFILSDDLPGDKRPARARTAEPQRAPEPPRPAEPAQQRQQHTQYQQPQVNDQRRVFLPPGAAAANGSHQPPQAAPQGRPGRPKAEDHGSPEWFTEPKGFPPVPADEQPPAPQQYAPQAAPPPPAQHQGHHQQPVQHQPAHQAPHQPPQAQPQQPVVHPPAQHRPPTRHAVPERLPTESDVPFLPLPPAPAGQRGYRTGDVERLVEILTRAATALDDVPSAAELEQARPGLTFFVGQGYHQEAVDALVERLAGRPARPGAVTG
ncbi:DivIVA domain-containing protein [Actinokineospora sp. G85]|uniref:DivIVA domain-containing protein n=1 Tax=Actinokineospora sp. G85 TaxID=3406626 RepID=UPI003C70EEE1